MASFSFPKMVTEVISLEFNSILFLVILHFWMCVVRMGGVCVNYCHYIPTGLYKWITMIIYIIDLNSSVLASQMHLPCLKLANYIAEFSKNGKPARARIELLWIPKADIISRFKFLKPSTNLAISFEFVSDPFKIAVAPSDRRFLDFEHWKVCL